MVSPPELNRDHEDVLPTDEVDNFEVGVGSHDLPILRPLRSLSECFTYLTFRDAAENHPLPRVAAREDSPRHPPK